MDQLATRKQHRLHQFDKMEKDDRICVVFVGEGGAQNAAWPSA